MPVQCVSVGALQRHLLKWIVSFAIQWEHNAVLIYHGLNTPDFVVL